MKTKNYLVFDGGKPITLEGFYNNDVQTLKNLDYNLEGIISVEAPITLNMLKQRLREQLNVKKISQKALDIILEHINKLGFVQTDNFYDIVFWPKKGEFKLNTLRVGYVRQIYDIPHQELTLLANDLNLKSEELYRAILAYFGYEVLTEKARNYLVFIEKMAK